MKIWIQDTHTPTHQIIKLNCEAHSNFTFLGDFDDTEILDFFQQTSETIEREKNLKLLKYYGYLHLLITKAKI